MKKKLEKEMLDAMSKNPDNWKGIFYFNPKDPRMIVPKYYSSLGWTLNFASAYSYVAILAVVVVLVVIAFI